MEIIRSRGLQLHADKHKGWTLHTTSLFQACRPWGRVSVTRWDGVGAGAGVEVYLFLKECCFKVRFRNRVDTNPQPNPNPNVERREEMWAGKSVREWGRPRALAATSKNPTWGALFKKKNLSRRRKLMPWYAIERCLLGVIKLIKTGT